MANANESKKAEADKKAAEAKAKAEKLAADAKAKAEKEAAEAKKAAEKAAKEAEREKEKAEKAAEREKERQAKKAERDQEKEAKKAERAAAAEAKKAERAAEKEKRKAEREANKGKPKPWEDLPAGAKQRPPRDGSVAAALLIYIKENKGATEAELQEKVGDVHGKGHNVRKLIRWMHTELGYGFTMTKSSQKITAQAPNLIVPTPKAEKAA